MTSHLCNYDITEMPKQKQPTREKSEKLHETRVSWLIARLAKIKGLGIHMPQLCNGGEGLGS